ncbi:unnamed protein product [Sphenostylis stenocarpa]|uniref:Uncharacterized protein n=1 Tax=Sphenostylis stenocarpa TaxID=92480 RepID=A0AA86T9W1_9FABA|nr:unnamed protein product [Sphenostylis stenocarpa]
MFRCGSDRNLSILCVPGSLYAICRAHHNGDGLTKWRMRSHACCVLLPKGVKAKGLDLELVSSGSDLVHLLVHEAKKLRRVVLLHGARVIIRLEWT